MHSVVPGDLGVERRGEQVRLPNGDDPTHRLAGRHAGDDLDVLADLGVEEALVTCDLDNAASEATMGGVGGVGVVTTIDLSDGPGVNLDLPNADVASP